MKYIVIYKELDPVFGSRENYIECENATMWFGLMVMRQPFLFKKIRSHFCDLTT